jgi:hypothetical protein
LRLIHAKKRSTTQRLGGTWKPTWSALKISGFPYRASDSFNATTRDSESMVFDN